MIACDAVAVSDIPESARNDAVKIYRSVRV